MTQESESIGLNVARKALNENHIFLIRHIAGLRYGGMTSPHEVEDILTNALFSYIKDITK